MLKIGHTVTVPPTFRGQGPDGESDTISIPQELETVPGIPQEPETVTFYARHYPIESHNVEHFAFRSWLREHTDIKELREEHETQIKPTITASRESGELEPTGEAVPGKDLTQEITVKAIDLGFAMVGFAAYDNRYTYVSKRKWVKPFPNAICLAMEQGYEETQTIPGPVAEANVFETYRREGSQALVLAEYIRSLGYHAQVQNPNDASAALHAMFVEAGMGQMGAMGYLLSPHFGSRHRLMLVTTDAPVTFGKPVDYGIHAFCTICQVCVNRCPGRALLRDKVWWRGVEKFKIIAKRCRPVMARYAACGVCMKVCPVQRFGLKPVLEHYAATGQVLGKGTHNLEGYEMYDMGYFGPGELPRFGSDFFHIPEGSRDGFIFENLKEKIASGGIPEGAEGDKVWAEFRQEIRESVLGPANYEDSLPDVDEF